MHRKMRNTRENKNEETGKGDDGGAEALSSDTDSPSSHPSPELSLSLLLPLSRC
jgi:hypothetical protein